MTQELTAPSILSLFETNRDQRTSFVKDIITRLQNGEVDPLEIHLQIKSMEDVINQLTNTDEKKNKNFALAKEYKEMLIEAASKHGKSFELHNAKFEQKEVGTKYDYSVCEDESYNELSKQMEDLKAKIKEREKFLQNVPEGGIADPTNGNMVYRAAKSSTTSIALTLK
jgi:hypothetical protein